MSWFKLAYSLGNQQHGFLTRTWSGRAPWNRSKFGVSNHSFRIFFSLFAIFESGGKTEYWMPDRKGNSEFCFQSALTFPSGSPRGRSRGNKTHRFPWDQSSASWIDHDSRWWEEGGRVGKGYENTKAIPYRPQIKEVLLQIPPDGIHIHSSFC